MKVKVTDASRAEGPLYAVQGEDSTLHVFDSTVTVLGADNKVYRHKTFTVKGFHEAREVDDGEWFHRTPNYNYKNEVQAFIDKIMARGFIDTAHWDEVIEESWDERNAYNLRCEADERAWGIG